MPRPNRTLRGTDPFPKDPQHKPWWMRLYVWIGNRLARRGVTFDENPDPPVTGSADPHA